MTVTAQGAISRCDAHRGHRPVRPTSSTPTSWSTNTFTAFAQVGDVITYTITVDQHRRRGPRTPSRRRLAVGRPLRLLRGIELRGGCLGVARLHLHGHGQQPGPGPERSDGDPGTGVTSEDVVDSLRQYCSTDILNPDISWSRRPARPRAGRRCDHLHDHRGPTPATRTSNAITASDSLLGDLSDSFADVNSSVDASESHDFTYTVTANSPDPVPNEVTAYRHGRDLRKMSWIVSANPAPRTSSTPTSPGREDLHGLLRRSAM